MLRVTHTLVLALLCPTLLFPAPPNDAERTRARQPHAALEADDPDVPPIVTIDKTRYLRERDAYVARLRGLPYPPDKPDARARAIRQMEEQEQAIYGSRAKTAYLPGQRQGSVNSTTWTPIGPAPLPNGQTTGGTSVPVSGRVTCIAVDPTDANTVYVGAAQGGVYRSLDGGATWTPLMDSALTLSIGALTIDPKDRTKLLVGTGEPNSSLDSFFGAGVYLITGANGVAPVLNGPYGTTSDVVNIGISRILVNPNDDNMVYVSTGYGFGGVSGDFPATRPKRGLYRSTNFMTGAPTFAQIVLSTANNSDRRVTDMIFDPTNPATMIVNVGGNSGVTDGGIWRSTNALDPTPAFSFVTAFNPATTINTVKFAVNVTGTVVTFIAATGETVNAANGCTASANGSIRKSTDGGATWSAPIAPAGGSGGFCNGQCDYDIGIAVDPSNANNILLGGSFDDTSGSNLCQASTQMQSTNGGTTFSRVVGVHADTHMIVFAPSSPTVAYAGDDGGIFKSVNGGATWTSLNNTTFSATQFMSLSVHPLDRWFSIGGTQDNGTPMIDGTAAWTRADFGDGGFALIDRNAADNSSLLMYHTYYNATNSILGFGRVSRVQDAHDNGWDFLGYGGINNGIANDPKVLFYAPMATGPGNPNAIYYGSDRLYRSSNGALNMAVVSQAPLVSGVAISAIAVAPANDNVRIVGLANGKVFATTTGSSTLTDITGSIPAQYVARAVIDPNNANVAYVTLSGFGLLPGQHVWKTTNISAGGAGWFASGSGIPDVPVDCLVIDPLNSNNVYAATDIGVYASADGGASWNPLGTGMPRVAVFGLDIQSPARILRAATHGRGLWELSIAGTQFPALAFQSIAAVEASGNNNGFVDPGEGGALTVTVANRGVVTATNVSVTIATATAGITIKNATSPVANIASGSNGANVTPLTFSVAPTVACGTVVTFTVTAGANALPAPVAQTFRFIVGEPAATPMTFAYSGATLSIPANNLNGALAPVNVSGVPAPVAKVTVTIGSSASSGITTSWAGDLQIFLVSPAGTTVPLDVNSGGNGTAFRGTVFDDAGASAFADAVAPFTGTYTPASPLAAFAGENAAGTWILKVVDGYPGDTGSVIAFSITITPASCAAVLAMPQNLVASRSGTTGANLAWDAVAGADHYDVYRSTNIASGFTKLSTSPATNAFSDSGLTAGLTYLYQVRAGSASAGNSDYSKIDPATLLAFTDDPLVALTTVVRAVHVSELRQAVNAMRAAANLAPATFTDSVLSTTTAIKAIHIGELRTALTAARTAIGLATVYTDDPLTAGASAVKAVHIQEIRNATQ